MSLVGRLEDLSPTDIIQIVFLSRRSGRLDMRVPSGVFSIFFSHGLISGVTSPDSPDLGATLLEEQGISEAQLAEARAVEAAGVPLAAFVIDCNIVPASELTAAIERRIGTVLDQISSFVEGEFDFVLGDGDTSRHLGYDLQALIGAEGFLPQKFLGAGEKMKPLQGLEESLRAGKAFLRTPAAEPAETVTEVREDPAPVESGETDAPLAATGRPEFGPDSTRPGAPASQFRIRDDGAGDPDGTPVPVLVYQPEPMLRVALKRALTDPGVEIIQSYSPDELRQEVTRMVDARRFFVSIVDTGSHGPPGTGASLIALIKRANPRLPVASIGDPSAPPNVMQMPVDEEVVLPAGDRYDISPSTERLAAFARAAIDRWRTTVAAGTSESEAGQELYEKASAERSSRRFELLELLILELSDPDDVLSLGRTLLRAASEYVDRGAIFVLRDSEFLGLAAFGTGGVEQGVNESIKGARIPFSEPSVLRDVAEGRSAHRGKLRKTPANVELVQRLGPSLPSEVVVLPILRGSTVVGVFYGDNGGNRTPVTETAGLEIFLGQAGRALEEGLNARAARVHGGGGEA